MTAPADDTTANVQAVIAALRAERDAALSEKAALAEALAQRNSEYGERLEQQAATIDVLKVMSSSPGNAQPVFQLIVERARTFCAADQTNLALLDGDMLHLEATSGASASYPAQFPRPVDATSTFGRAIIARDVVQMPDVLVDPDHFRATLHAGATVRAVVAVPLLRGGAPVGAIAMGRNIPGEFSATQMELLKTFAEQAVIAITSAETYRALQTRTADLQETLEYQTATSDVLKVISRSTFDLQPVLDTVAETAARLCDADQAAIFRREGGLIRFVTNCGFPSEYEAHLKGLGTYAFDPYPQNVTTRAIREGRTVHINDVALIPGYAEQAITLGKQRTSLGVPLLREGEAIGVIVLARQRVEPFTDRQIELASTFADQAVIAIENTRLLNEQREALEQQTATAEVLQVINASPGNLAPVFDALLEKAIRLCSSAFGTLWTYDGQIMRPVATRGLTPEQEVLLVDRHPAAGQPAGRIASGEDVVHLLDAREQDGYRVGFGPTRFFVDQVGARTVMWVALRKDKELLGILTIFRREVRAFTEKEVELVQSFAAQAVIAMENARLLTEQREALEQQTATAEVLQVINSSPGDLAPVFDAVLEKAMRLCGAAFGSLYTYDGDRFLSAAQRGVPPAYAEFRAQHPPTLEQGGGPAAILQTRRPFHVLDVKEHEIYQRGWPGARAMVELGGVRTSLIVPLLKDDAVLGFISIYRQEVRAYSDKEITILENFAAQAVIAMENARLLTEQREALEQQTATAEVLQVINASPGDLKPVFEAILDKAHTLCGATMGSLVLYDGTHLRAAATLGYPERYAEVVRQPQPPTIRIQALIRGERFIHVLDMKEDEDELKHAVARSRLGSTEIRTALWMPLCKDSNFLGFISAYRTEVQAFSERQIALLENFAGQAVIAMENARLLTEQREALEQQTATAEVLRVINASPGELAPVFDVLLEKALTLCGSAFGALHIFDDKLLHVVASHGLPDALNSFYRQPILPAPGMTVYRVVLGEDVVHVADLADDEAFRSRLPTRAALVDLGGARTQLIVALRKDNKLIGVIMVFRREVRRYSDKEISLLRAFADQAVIAKENARLMTEQREALEQQTATSEVLGVINASPGNLEPVFEALLEKAMRLCGAAFGSLYTFDGASFRSAAQRGVPAAYSAIRERTPPSGQSGGPATRILQTKRTVHILDMVSEEVYKSGLAGVRDLVELGGARTVLGVPLLKDDTVQGYISIYRQEVRAFTDKQIALLENFAAQAVIAMENARLLNEQREALEQQTATAEVLQVINTNPGNLVPVFDAMLNKAVDLCGAAFGILLTYDGERFHHVAFRSIPEAYVEFMREHPPIYRPESAPGRIALGERLVHMLDITDTDAYRSGEPNRRAMADLAGARTVLSVALCKDEVLLGVLTLFRKEVRAFTDKQIALLQNFAAQAVIAMENARLLDAIRQRQEELRVTFENMGDGVALFDETRHLAASNRRFQDMLEVPDDVIASRPAFADYIRYLADHGEYGPEPEDHVQQLLALGSQRRTFERTRPNGRIIEIRVNPATGGGFVVIYSDITDRKRSEEEIRAARDAAEEASRTIEAAYRDLKAAQANLIQAEKMASLGQLTAGIAHEIKNPLNFVNNFAELSGDLLDELNDAIAGNRQAELDELRVTLQGNLAKITEHGKRADDIVKAMLEHSRGSSGERRMVDLNALVDEALNLAYHGARAQDQSFNITLERDFAEGISPIELAPQDMTRVFLNLFSNGFYAVTRRAHEGGEAEFVPTLKVATRDAGEAVEVRVWDNGIGISADIRDKLFQPFFTTKPTGEGTGLGLSITYDIVTQQHGGSITVDSKVGEYSEFVIRLPR